MPNRIGRPEAPSIPQPVTTTPPTAEVSPTLDTTVELDSTSDSFSVTEAITHTDVPAVSTSPAETAHTVSTPLGLLHSSQASLLAQHNEVKEAIADAVATFPEDARAGVQSALETSADRIMTSLETGSITLDEAVTSMEMVREMVEGLTDIRTGEVEVIHEATHGDNVKVWNVRAPDGDELVVSARFEIDDQGEARMSFRHIVDDGVRLKGRHRMSIRLDLERWGTPSVDVQFGESALDKRIHGLYKNPDGSVFTTPSGKMLADHHFRDNIPASLSDPTAFSSLITAFANDTMEPLPVNLDEPT